MEVEFERLPRRIAGSLHVPLLGYTRAIIYRACVEQAYYRRPWASEEDIQKQDPKFKVRLDWGEKKEKNGKSSCGR
ncbi:MAG: hypothetical protein RLZZ358_2316 [Bacteroidota bacterium]